MAKYLIGYDLRFPGQDYEALIDAIKDLGRWWHCLDSTWIVICNQNAEQIRNHLVQFIDNNDKILITKLPDVAHAAWRGFDENCANWLRDYL